MEQPTRSPLTPRSRAHREAAQRPHYVYELWSKRDCLYVGMSINPGNRIAQHQATKYWWAHVEDIKITRYGDREAARLAEQAAILDLEPAWNINSTDHPTGRRVR